MHLKYAFERQTPAIAMHTKFAFIIELDVLVNSSSKRVLSIQGFWKLAATQVPLCTQNSHSSILAWQSREYFPILSVLVSIFVSIYDKGKGGFSSTRRSSCRNNR